VEVVPYAVVLYLDDEADRLVRSIWAALDRRGVPSPGREHTGNQPHVTLALFDHCDPARVASALSPSLAAAIGIPLELVSLGFFLTPRAPAFLGVVPSPPLLHLHQRVQIIIRPFVAGNSPYYEPPNWLPHCTLAMRALDAVGEIIATVAGRALPIRGRAGAATLVRLPEPVTSGPPAPASDILSGQRPPPPSWAIR
jgi:2'-5' RNA ligase